MTTTRERCERAVRHALARNAEVEPSADRLAVTDDLYEHGLTSLASARVMLAVEGELEIEFPERILGRALFASIERLTDACVDLLETEGAAR
ncbi:acyl carrier protein [Kitasatospora sp. NPDC086801]|uniref:acyl carrier protein n=1 Tax=Kitasatospora sp. NPDC086801 TaxID=3364066 RepID=UPI00381ECD8B